MSDYFKLSNTVFVPTSTATAAGTTTLTAASNSVQRFTGTLTQIVQLPAANTLPVGRAFLIQNRSTGSVTVNDGAGGLIEVLTANSQQTFVVRVNSSIAGSWDLAGDSGISSGGGSASVSTSDTLKQLQGLASGLVYSDGSIISKRVKFNPEEISANVWVSKGQLSIGRQQPGGFTLNGYLYGPGGINSSSVTLTINEQFNDDNNFWLTKAPMNLAKAQEGTFSVGGFGYTMPAAFTGVDVEQYSDANDAWTTKNNGPSNLTETATFVINGSAYSCGGTTGAGPFPTTQTYVYDATNDAWRLRTPMNIPSYGAMAFGLNTLGYNFGGSDSSGNPLSGIQKYSDVTNAWTTLVATLATARNFGAYFTANGFGYINGGSNPGLTSTERFYDVTNVMVTVASCATARFTLGSEGLNGSGYIYGGLPGYFTSTEQYRGSNDFFLGSVLNTKATPATILAAVALNNLSPSVRVQIRTDSDNWKNLSGNVDSSLKNGEILKNKFTESNLAYVSSGSDGSGNGTTSQEFYNESANTWTTRGAWSTARQWAGGFSLNGKGYQFSGYFTAAPYLTSMEVYTETSNTTTSKASLPVVPAEAVGEKLNGFGYAGNENTAMYQYNDTLDSWATKAGENVVAVSRYPFTTLFGRLYATGGQNAGYQTRVERYSDSLNTWTTITSLNHQRSGHNSFALNGHLFAFTGVEDGGVYGSGTERYDTTTNAWTSVATVSQGTEDGTAHSSHGFGYMFCGQIPGLADNQSEQYNDGSNVWTSKANTNTARYAPTKGYATGAYRNYEVRISIPAFIAAVGSGVWVSKTALTTAKEFSACENVKGIIWAGPGGSNTTSELYSEASNTWRIGPSIGFSPNSCSSFSLNGSLFLNVNSTTEKVDDITNTWVVRASDPHARTRMSKNSNTLNSFGYTFGSSGASSFTAISRYDDSANTFTDVANLITTDREYCGSAVVDGYLYVYSGWGGSTTNAIIATTEIYNDTTSTATSAAAFPGTAGYGPGSFVTNGRAAAAGGALVDGSTGTSQNYEYNPVSNVWYARSNLLSIGCFFGAASLSGTGYLVGRRSSGSPTSEVQQYVPSLNSVILGVGLEIK